ncbi:UNVERIFIED_CONTAM: hypothetical protein GTU68_038093 [Idotea baltica]|nr:hypothetical protein [Idotea baltica]
MPPPEKSNSIVNASPVILWLTQTAKFLLVATPAQDQIFMDSQVVSLVLLKASVMAIQS